MLTYVSDGRCLHGCVYFYFAIEHSILLFFLVFSIRMRESERACPAVPPQCARAVGKMRAAKSSGGSWWIFPFIRPTFSSAMASSSSFHLLFLLLGSIRPARASDQHFFFFLFYWIQIWIISRQILNGFQKSVKLNFPVDFRNIFCSRLRRRGFFFVSGILVVIRKREEGKLAHPSPFVAPVVVH